MGELDHTERQDDTAGVDDRRRSARAHMRVALGCSPCAVVEIPPSGISVGRATGGAVDLTLDDPRLSRRHLRVEAGVFGWTLVDTGSRNGGFLNGRAFAPGQRAVLSDGAVVRVGDSLLVFRAAPAARDDPDDAMFPGVSALAAEVRGQLRTLAATTGHVLIQGETGTGKEHAARFLGAARAPSPFVPQNCAELRRELARSELFGHVRGAFSGATTAHPGLIETAAAGVLFLDEIGELPLDVQGDLLRFLDDGSYRRVGATELRKSRARVVAATNVDLDDAVRTGRFRRDLLARLRAGNPALELPPLRARPEDILGWAARIAAELGGPAPAPLFSAGAAECLLLHVWPENLRELRGLVRSLVAAELREPAASDRLPAPLRARRNAMRAGPATARPIAAGRSKEPTREEIVAALERHGGRMRSAALTLGLERRKLYRLCERHAIDPDAARRRAGVADDDAD